MMRVLPKIIWPAMDAWLGHSVQHRAFRRHAWRYPMAQSLAGRDQQVAQAFGYHTDADWGLRHALSPALDRRDDWLLAGGHWSKLLDEVDVVGQWPDEPFVALGTHWGAGLPTLAHLAMRQRTPCFVYRAEPDGLRSGWVDRWVHRLHLKALERAGGLIALGGAYQKITESLAMGHTPVVLMDAPSEGRPALVGRDGDFTLNIRRSLLTMLTEERIRFVFYRCGFDPTSHRRHLSISSSSVETVPQRIADAAATWLQQALQLDAAQWRLWMVADALLSPPSQ